MLTLAMAINAASANRLSVSNQRFRAVWANLEMANNVTSEIVRCPVTLEGSFHSSTMAKVVHGLVGYVSRASVGNAVCTGGHVTVNQETLPWHLRYESFTGSLPSISQIRTSLTRASFIVETESNICKVTTSAESPIVIILELFGSTVTTVRIDPTARIPLTNGPGGNFCGLVSGIAAGTGSFTLLGNASAISIRLI
jgi:hypothetical protein